jgi:hypothetical protein
MGAQQSARRWRVFCNPSSMTIRFALSATMLLFVFGCPAPADDPCDGCLIAGTCHPHGEADEANSCRRCDTVMNPTGWTDNDGQVCDDGVFCNGADSCAAGACSVHAGLRCGEGLSCNEVDDTCDVACAGCVIEGNCVAEGAANPANPCEACLTARSTTGWSADDTASCDDGLFCTGVESCSGGTCTRTTPCADGESCFEEEDQCCAPAGLGCGVGDDVYEIDSCGRQGALVRACDACLDGRCVCDPVEQTGCLTAERCTWSDGVTTCFPDGERQLAQSCSSPDAGVDDCAAGTFCLDGECVEICSAMPNSCPGGLECVVEAARFDDVANVGVCTIGCSVIAQDCPDGEACYITPTTAVSSCGGVPDDAQGVVQDDPCHGPQPGSCYLNGCDMGYGANLPDGLCAFFCNPVDNWLNNVAGLAGDPDGVGCDETFDGGRPDGPGAGYECRYLQSFYSNTERVPAFIGMCVSTAEGSCANFDLVQRLSDIADGTAADADYCANNPNNCLPGCVSNNTLNP